MQQQELVAAQFGATASAYLTSAVHASGADLQQLKDELAALIPETNRPRSRVLDLGCGAGHASFAAAAVAGEVTAYDLSADMLAVVEAAARERGLSNIRTRDYLDAWVRHQLREDVQAGHPESGDANP